LAPTPAAAASSTPPSQTSLPQAEQQLTTLNDQLERAGAALDAINRQLGADVTREATLHRRLAALARLQYQRPALSLTLVLSARSLDELISDLSQARLVAGKQQSMLDQSRQLH